jgi:hypothetical protein
MRNRKNVYPCYNQTQQYEDTAGQVNNRKTTNEKKVNNGLEYDDNDGNSVNDFISGNFAMGEVEDNKSKTIYADHNIPKDNVSE